MEGMKNGRKGKCFSHVLKDSAQALGLLLAIGKDVKVITLCFELSKRGAQEVEVFVKQRLEFYLETHNGIGRAVGFCTEFKTLATRKFTQHFRTVCQYIFALKLSADFGNLHFGGRLALNNSLFGKSLIVSGVDAFADEEKIACE